MPCVKCSVCGGAIKMKGKNHKTVDGEERHIRCPAPKFSDEEKALLPEFKKTITNALVDYGSQEARERGLNWKYIFFQVSKFRKEGYSLSDQLYCFNKCIERDKAFWGYGRIAKFIAQDTESHRRILEATKLETTEVKRTYNLSTWGDMNDF